MGEVLERRESIYPTRIVKTAGRILFPEHLLEEKPLILIPSFKEELNTCLQKEGEENPYLLLDFGRELQGGVRLVISHVNPAVRRIRLVFGESVTECMTEVGVKGSENTHSARDTVVEVHNLSIRDFGRQGFRFVKIELLDEGVLWLKNVAAIAVTAPYEKKGYLKTSDPLLNQIIDTAVYTCFINAQEGVIWDGVKRDRLVWSGDLNTEILTLAYQYGMIPNVKNCLEILRAESRADRWMNGIPSYSVWWILNLVDYYLFSDDAQFVRESVPFVNEILRDLDGCIDENSVDFSRAGKYSEMEFFFDWPTYETRDAIVGTMLLIDYTMTKLEKVAIDGVEYGIVEKLLACAKKYRTEKAEKKQTIALQALCGGDKDSAKIKLEAGGAKGFSTFTCYFLLKALRECGSERALELAKTYYGGMLSRGATTFWEDFDIDWMEGSGRIDEETPSGLKDLHSDYGAFCYEGLKHSLCHGWSSGVVGYLVESVFGLQVLAPGYKRVKIQPALSGLDWIEGSIPTPYGNIFIRAEKSGEGKIVLPDSVERVE